MFSVIVPVYNAEKYLDMCLDSISSQTFRDFECIIIDDGSTDGSSAILDKYIKIDQRFKVIHQINMGPSAARNAGLDIAQGDYITFVDSDDSIANDYLEKFALQIQVSNADIVICGLLEVYEDSIIERVFESEDTAEIKKNILADFWPAYPCNKCYKKHLFENIRFPLGVFFEDLLVIPKICLSARKIICISDKLYYYNRKNKSSTTADITIEKMYNIFQGRLNNRQLAVENGVNCLNLLDKKIIKDTLRCLMRNCNDHKLSEFEEQEMLSYLKERFDKSEVYGAKNKFWVKMLLEKRKSLCAWYARFRKY